jgi:hypothetical protein
MEVMVDMEVMDLGDMEALVAGKYSIKRKNFVFL